jgi:uncharacterized protein
MALLLEGRNIAPTSPEKVWACLNDVEILKDSIPGCEVLEKQDATTFSGVVLFKIGPVKARFKGKVTLTDLDPPHSCRILGEGEGGIAGFGKGAASVTLKAIPEGTEIYYVIDASIGGKIAQLGSRLMAGTIRKLADEFFTAFAARVAEETVP